MNVPNALTLVRIILIPVFVLFYVFQIPDWNLWAAIVFIAASVTDLLDGYLARKWNQITDFGKLMDPMADKLLVLAALLIIQDWNIIPFWVTLVLLAREFIISAFRMIAVSKGKVVATSYHHSVQLSLVLFVALTVCQMVALALLLLNGWFFGMFGIAWFDNMLGMILIYISVALSVISCILYFKKNKGVLE